MSYGPNALARADVVPAWIKFMNQFRDLMIILLIVTAGLSVYLQDYRTAIILSIIVMVNAIIGYLQEAKAERMLEALEKMVHPSAKVKIAGELREVASEALVP
ncbi:MAG: hypothetical protein H6765_03765 [Candidatus Peribacteria bacterium]|nr:MAG: hypothetical protein H6765_03765 [Candidatus Peribacteria bacterium]